ncbi:MAG: acyl-CoA dehydrogenase [Acidimicrobiaceae bacterium]|nr:acyl-CoA/acyl-ACP dehydrogenase [Acidimicrobiaceae bacterium]MDE0517522.1 acyl-CoA/acyl-ACP dehydrogenase [Acidimicrobiaceae bacterium]MDE0655196.1 acyl-CoA/acyl-ACP dehydrogenase [Acidimicrobiaceae bacterium]MXZ95934.1 acyl-CoA dehydrogenase [Acidimicrobiaceae bacterium]MYF41905.1 acyl-CoA dehydrogenase [Acidimicrobiaceae bacterium]
MLDLDFTQEQEMLRDMVRGLCSELSPLERVRELEDDPDGIHRELWQRFGELGLCGLIVPESAGGSGMSLLDGVVLYEELGRSLAPLPHFVSCVLSAGAIAQAGTPAQQAELLGGIASGETIATVGWLEPGGGYKPRGVQLAARANGDGFVLDGSKEHVQFAAAADLIVVLARSGHGDTDIDLFVVEADASGLSLDQRMSISSDTQYLATLDGVPVPADARLGTAGAPVGAGWEAWQHAMHAGAILAAAQAVGGASAALEMTVEYAKERRQFNKALAEFQAISHYLADARTALDGAQLLVYEAAWAHNTGRSTDQLAPMAKLFACRTYREVTAMCQQVFGGIGFTVEYDIQLYFRRAKQLQLSWWDQAACEDRIADAVLGSA